VIDEYSEITDDDEEIFPKYITQNNLEFWFTDELLEDVTFNTLKQKASATNEEILKAIKYYNDRDSFMKLWKNIMNYVHSLKKLSRTTYDERGRFIFWFSATKIILSHFGPPFRTKILTKQKISLKKFLLGRQAPFWSRLFFEMWLAQSIQTTFQVSNYQMNPKGFVTEIKTTIVEENLSIYKDLFSSTSIKDVTDEYWKRALTLFNSLPAEQREVFFEVIRQTMVDTTSNILGIIDGVSVINHESDEFSLTYGDDKKSLFGDLQSLFLAEEEKT